MLSFYLHKTQLFSTTLEKASFKVSSSSSIDSISVKLCLYLPNKKGRTIKRKHQSTNLFSAFLGGNEWHEQNCPIGNEHSRGYHKLSLEPRGHRSQSSRPYFAHNTERPFRKGSWLPLEIRQGLDAINDRCACPAIQRIDVNGILAFKGRVRPCRFGSCLKIASTKLRRKNTLRIEMLYKKLFW